MNTLETARLAAMMFVREEAGFAQMVSLDLRGFPVGRSMTAFLEDDWSVSLVQRRTHARLEQLRAKPRALVTWVGTPTAGMTNEHPHVFDIGRLPSRAVFVRGTTEFMDEDWTRHCYRKQVAEQRAHGHVAAPLRDAEQIARDLVGVRLVPFRVRLEGFGDDPTPCEWSSDNIKGET